MPRVLRAPGGGSMSIVAGDLVGYSATSSSGSTVVTICEVVGVRPDVVLRDLAQNLRQVNVDLGRLRRVTPSTAPAPRPETLSLALWNNEWGGLRRQWALSYHACVLQRVDEDVRAVFAIPLSPFA